MPRSWGQLWPELEAFLQEVLADVTSIRPGLWSDLGWHSNDFFPFRAYLSLMAVADPDGDDDVVLSADFHVAGDLCRFTSDIAAGDGQILADGPASARTLTDTDQDLAWARDRLGDFMTFVTGELPLVRATLAPA